MTLMTNMLHSFVVFDSKIFMSHISFIVYEGAGEVSFKETCVSMSMDLEKNINPH